jgi:hypothetical protein
VGRTPMPQGGNLVKLVGACGRVAPGGSSFLTSHPRSHLLLRLQWLGPTLVHSILEVTGITAFLRSPWQLFRGTSMKVLTPTIACPLEVARRGHPCLLRLLPMLRITRNSSHTATPAPAAHGGPSPFQEVLVTSHHTSHHRAHHPRCQRRGTMGVAKGALMLQPALWMAQLAVVTSPLTTRARSSMRWQMLSRRLSGSRCGTGHLSRATLLRHQAQVSRRGLAPRLEPSPRLAHVRAGSMDGRPSRINKTDSDTRSVEGWPQLVDGLEKPWN